MNLLQFSNAAHITISGASSHFLWRYFSKFLSIINLNNELSLLHIINYSSNLKLVDLRLVSISVCSYASKSLELLPLAVRYLNFHITYSAWFRANLSPLINVAAIGVFVFHQINIDNISIHIVGFVHGKITVAKFYL